ncbi:MAG: hypothetical protein KBT19_00445 [Lachnospiraceae bacterium]|nr:hypothetical protein [Candidatus Colinaster equi]
MKKEDIDLLDLDVTAGWRQLDVEQAVDGIMTEYDSIADASATVNTKPKEATHVKPKKRVETAPAKQHKKSATAASAKPKKRVETAPVKQHKKSATAASAKSKKRVEAAPAKSKKRVEAAPVKQHKKSASAASVKQSSKNVSRKSSRGKKKSFWQELSAIDYIIAATGIVVVAAAVVVGIMYSNNLTKTRMLDGFKPIGAQLSEIGIAGESTLLTMADNKRLALEEEEYSVAEYEEKELEDDEVTVKLVTQSVVKDLKVKFVNKSSEKLIAGVPFEVEVTDAAKKTKTYTDDDKDGVIYLKKMTPGEASVKMHALSGYDKYKISTDSVKVTIKENLDYKKIDVSDEVKKESQINVAKEDTAKKEAGGQALADTVEWVESTKTLIDGDVSYSAISKDEISDPYASAALGTLTRAQIALLTAEVVPNESENSSEQESETTSEEHKEEKTEESAPEKKDVDTSAPLKDRSGNQVYICRDGEYYEAKVEDYNNYSEFYLKSSSENYKYTGWQDIDGHTMFFDKDGNKVTGEQVIQGVRYTFDGDGYLQKGSGSMGIDVSKWNGSIDWNKVKNAGVNYVIIRCGYRGSTTGALIEDPTFRSNIKGATAAGLKVGVYFFTQATDEVEAVEEASMTLSLIGGYGLSLPVFLDVESSGGRGDGIDAGTRTKVINAYCQTIRNSGYSAGVYANKTWLTQKFNPGGLSGCRIWLAQYTEQPTYGGHYDMWQYTSAGKIDGISGKVDMNISYMN